MCGWCNTKEGFVFTQFGPLWIVALLGRAGLSLRDLRAWDHSRISAVEGTIAPVSAWHEGKTVTMGQIKFLFKRREVMIQKAVALAERQKGRQQAKLKPGP
jgi:hypothetical protein